MKISISEEKLAAFTNVFRIDLLCYIGDADYYFSISIHANEIDLPCLVAEIELVKNQFDGRGGCRRMYNQCEYFCLSDEAWAANPDHADSYWAWLNYDSDYPFDCSSEVNATLESYKVVWLDHNSHEHAVTIDGLENLRNQISCLNSGHSLGDFKVWDDERENLNERFAAYRIDAIDLVKKFGYIE